ncbi:uncharacterized protein BYT42DRAFT_610640 [Radiomyces spectabilis]|uniref:uncharacterized protein n=1 Tax=Radiomyces spectabilis TaxID=64574 RepID=UPI00221FFE9A|nr:uncharacterized protein BYT42DRAFT_610640 [Radiomyces spectabilis]KAI8391406.1 hypothetical protein BYT42DRAFT_610640 [Radiomyces spectabilis]
MYGVKGTTSFINTVARQGVLSKQLTAAHATPKTTAYLNSFPSRNVSAKFSYTTSRASTQFGPNKSSLQQQQQDQNDNSSRSRFQGRHQWPLSKLSTTQQLRFRSTLNAATEVLSEAPSVGELNARILEAARKNNPQAVVAEFTAGKEAGAQLSEQTYEAVVKAYGTLRKENQSLKPLLSVYDDMVAHGIRPTSHTYAMLIRSLCLRDREVNKTLTMLRNRNARFAGTVSANDLTDLESENNFEQAIALFNQAVQENQTQDFDTDLYNKLLQTVSHKGNTKDGLYIFEQLENAKNAKANSVTFAALVSLFGVAGDLGAINECFMEYQVLKKKLDRHHEPLVVYNALVRAYIDAGDLQGAINVVDQVMPNDKVEASIFTYNLIIRKVCSDGDLPKAAELIEKLVSDPSLPKPDEHTYSHLLTAYCRAGDLAKATETYEVLIQKDISKQFGHLANYIQLCARQGEPDKAVSVITDMCGRGLNLDVNLSRTVISAYIKAGNWAKVTATLDKFVDLYFRHTYVRNGSPMVDYVHEVATEAKDLATSLKVMQIMMKWKIPSSGTVAEKIARKYEMTKRDPEAWAAFTRTANELSFNTLYEAAFRREDSRETFITMAFSLLSDMIAVGVQPTGSLYVRVQARLQKYATYEAEVRWKEQFAPFLPVIEERIAQEQQEIGDSDKSTAPAVTMLSDMQSGEALGAALSGDFDKAISIMKEKIIDQGYVPTPEAVRDMIQHASKFNNLQAAQSIFETVGPSLHRLDKHRLTRGNQVILNTMLVAYARNNQFPMAQSYYQKLREQNLLPDGDAYASLLACAGNSPDDASMDPLKIYKEVKQHKVRLSVYFFNVAISRLVKTNRIDDALHIFRDMKAEGFQPNSVTYAAVISACLHQHDEAQATRYFNEMVSSPKYQPRIGAFNHMIQYYWQQDNPNKALEYYHLLHQYNLKPSDHTTRLLQQIQGEEAVTAA